MAILTRKCYHDGFMHGALGFQILSCPGLLESQHGLWKSARFC